MAGINKVIILGRLGKEPEMRTMPNGDNVARLSVATSENWIDKQSGEKKEVTEWHNVIAFRQLANIIGQYLDKGSQVYVEGKLKTRKWQDQNGQDRYTTEIIADKLEMLRGTLQDKQSPTHAKPKQPEGWNGYAEGELDDDIPF